MKKNIIRVIVYGLLAFVWLDYLAWNYHRIKYGRKVQHIDCVNNLKQIELACRIWAGDNGGNFPFKTSTNAGGTLEWCAPDKDGFDANAYVFLRTMSNELGTTKLLICPLDHAKKYGDWGSLSDGNITYRFRTGYRVSTVNPREVLALCPLDGNVLYVDGMIVDKHGKQLSGNDGDQNALQVRP